MNDHHNDDDDEATVAHTYLMCGIWYFYHRFQLDSLNTFTANALYTFHVSFFSSSFFCVLHSTCATSNKSNAPHYQFEIGSWFCFFPFFFYIFLFFFSVFSIITSNSFDTNICHFGHIPFHTTNHWPIAWCKFTFFLLPWFPNTADSLTIFFVSSLALYMFCKVYFFFFFGSNRKWISIISSFKFCTLRDWNICFQSLFNVQVLMVRLMIVVVVVAVCGLYVRNDIITFLKMFTFSFYHRTFCDRLLAVGRPNSNLDWVSSSISLNEEKKTHHNSYSNNTFVDIQTTTTYYIFLLPEMIWHCFRDDLLMFVYQYHIRISHLLLLVAYEEEPFEK